MPGRVHVAFIPLTDLALPIDGDETRICESYVEGDQKIGVQPMDFRVKKRRLSPWC